MRRGEYFIIFGLLLLQALGALYFGQLVEHFLVEIVVAAWFLLVAGLFFSLAIDHRKHAAAVALFGFLVSVVHLVMISLFVVSLWLVILLALTVVGMILAWDIFDRKKKVVSQHMMDRKKILEKELPPKEPTKVVVYHEDQQISSEKKSVQKKKPRKAVKKVAKKKVAKKKRTPKTASKKGKSTKRT